MRNEILERLKKLEKAADQLRERVTATHPEIEEYLEEEWFRVLRGAMDKGYDVMAKSSKRYIETGNHFVDWWLDSPEHRKLYPDRVQITDRYKVTNAKDPKNPKLTALRDQNVTVVGTRDDLFGSGSERGTGWQPPRPRKK